MNYKKAREDFEVLEKIAELSDQVDLDSARLSLMQNPTKGNAAKMYCSGIQLWFREHGMKAGSWNIAARHGIKLKLNE